MAALGYDPDRLEILITQLVNITRGGEPVRMSTRAGEFITFREVLAEVGTDATRYFLAAFSPDTAMTFDLDVARRSRWTTPSTTCSTPMLGCARSNDSPQNRVWCASAGGSRSDSPHPPGRSRVASPDRSAG